MILGKAGRSRHRGIRPINRGVTKNPVDHPNGGGQGKSKSGGGWQQLMSPWGKVAKGGKTRVKYKSVSYTHLSITTSCTPQTTPPKPVP